MWLYYVTQIVLVFVDLEDISSDNILYDFKNNAFQTT